MLIVIFFFNGDDFLLDFAYFFAVELKRIIVEFFGDPPAGLSNSVCLPPVLIGDLAVELKAEVFTIC